MICYHCEEAVTETARWQVQFDDQMRDVCCIGCQAVMQAIVDSGLGDYYRFRTEPAVLGVLPDELAKKLDELAVFDQPEISERYLTAADEDASTSSDAPYATLYDVSVAVEGLRCGACVWVLEQSVKALPGVSLATVNFSSARASVRFDPERIQLSEILRRMTQIGYQGLPFDARRREASLKRESRVFVQRLFVAGIATMQVMMYALPAYISEAGEIAPEYEQLLRWASLVLTTPVLLYSARPFLSGAWLDIKRRKPGMDVPVCIGILAAYFASVWATITGLGEIYFDSVAMFVFLLLGARYLEWCARRRAMRAVDDISAAAPESAQRIVDGQVERVPAARLQVGDLIKVDNGERVPVDARVHQGTSAIDNALITGESVPDVVGPGDAVAGGALLTGAPLKLRVERQQAASTLSVIDRLIERGASEKPRAARVADQIATVFVSVLLVFAVGVWLIWLQLDPARAGQTAIAVLVVSCPCALSLATPAALAVATGELLRNRLLITRGHVLETLEQVTDIVFDKTGTLTLGTPELIKVRLGKDQTRHRVLAIASELESGASHPYAQALRRAWSAMSRDRQTVDTEGLNIDSASLKHAAGHGVSATLVGQGVVHLGSARWCSVAANVQTQWQADDTADEHAASEVYLTLQPGTGKVEQSPIVLARFLLSDGLRPEVASLVTHLRAQGMHLHLLSGDRAVAVESVCRQLGIAQYQAAVTPEQKQDYVKALQARGSVVMMVGDGVNDAPVLAAADVSMAAGEATSLARTAADVISLLPGLEGLEPLLHKSAQTLRIMRQNLAWAALYNLCAIPLAALGYVPPWAAAIGMAGSSLLVAANAQRLWGVQAIRHSPGKLHETSNS